MATPSAPTPQASSPAPSELRPTPDLDAVIQRMDHRLAELRTAGDRRERFLLMYRTFKEELRRNLQEGRFRDSDWSEAICCRMGEMYFEADDAYRADPRAAPGPWAHCFDSAAEKRNNLLQDMLLGMNAHINYDLPLCTYDVMEQFGDTGELRRGAETSLRFRKLLRRRYYDFLLINEIAWESIPRIQDVVCDRFNRLLKLANLLSFRFSRHVTERIICEYRDRAWAHTLVLLTSRGDQDTEATHRHLSRFALRAAGLVDRLTLNPLKHLAGSDGEASDADAMAAVSRVLVDNLSYRPTRAIARQALEEYGPEVQAVIIRTLEKAPPLAAVRGQLYRVLAAHPTPDAVAALARALEREREVRGQLLRVTAQVAAEAADPVPLQKPALAIAGEELEAAQRLVDLSDDRFQDTLLDEALRNRLHRAVCRIGYAIRTTGVRVPESLTRCEFGPRYTPPLQKLDGWVQDMTVLARLARADVADADTAADPGEPAAAGEPAGPEGHEATVVPEAGAGGQPAGAEDRDPRPALVQLAEYPDPWLRTCAALCIGSQDNKELATALRDRVLHDDHELVKETALAAARRVMDPEALREAAAGLLKRHTYAEDTPARRLATQIQDGEVTMITNIEKALHLKNVTLFQDVLAEDLVTIARVAKEHRFKAGEQLIERGAPGMATFVIVEGEVEVSREGRTLATVGPGAVLGEMSVVSDMPTSADCVARAAGLALRIARRDFHALLQDYPTTAIGVMHVLAERLRETNVLAVEGE